MTSLDDLDALAETTDGFFSPHIHRHARAVLRAHLGGRALDLIQVDVDTREWPAQPRGQLTITVLAPGALVLLRADRTPDYPRALLIHELRVRRAQRVALEPIATGGPGHFGAVTGARELVDWAASLTLAFEGGAQERLALGSDADVASWEPTRRLRLVLGDRPAPVRPGAVPWPSVTRSSPRRPAVF